MASVSILAPQTFHVQRFDKGDSEFMGIRADLSHAPELKAKYPNGASSPIRILLLGGCTSCSVHRPEVLARQMKVDVIIVSDSYIDRSLSRILGVTITTDLMMHVFPPSAYAHAPIVFDATITRDWVATVTGVQALPPVVR